MIKQKGKIVQWNDDRGFGFIQPIGTTQTLFFHVSGMSHRERPALDRVVFFNRATGEDGRAQAVDIQYSQPLKANRQRAADQPLTPKGLISALYLLGICGLAAIERLPMIGVAWIVLVSVVTFLTYRADKQKAQQGAWRTPESTLHLLALMGGWSGALLAQQVLRHKSKKVEFLTVFWATVAVNLVCVLGWALLGGSQVLGLLTSLLH
jgi:uncharacterized membrane protein YsdA (DUF1294 family)/cold shock CspA family protein